MKMKTMIQNQYQVWLPLLGALWGLAGMTLVQAQGNSSKTLVPLSDDNAAELGFDLAMLKDGAVWKNRIENPRTITKISFSRNLDGEVMIRAWGACTPSDCDWGESPVLVRGRGKDATLVVLWDKGFCEIVQELSLRGRGIRLESSTVYTDDSKRKDQSYTDEFVKG